MNGLLVSACLGRLFLIFPVEKVWGQAVLTAVPREQVLWQRVWRAKTLWHLLWQNDTKLRHSYSRCRQRFGRLRLNVCWIQMWCLHLELDATKLQNWHPADAHNWSPPSSLYIAFSKTSFSQTRSSSLLTLLSPVLVLELLEFVFPLLLLQLLLVTLLLHLPLVLQQLLLMLQSQELLLLLQEEKHHNHVSKRLNRIEIWLIFETLWKVIVG